MPIVIIAAIGVGILFLLKQREEVPTPEQSSKDAQSQTEAAKPVTEKEVQAAVGASVAATGAAVATALGMSAGLGAGAVAVTAAGAAVGSYVTGTTLGTVVGAVSPVVGNAANVGVKLGESVDKALGGTGSGLSGITAQVTGGTIGVGAVVFGASVAAVALATVAPLAFGLASAIDDISRLKYGQKGAAATLEQKRTEIRKKVYEELIKKNPGRDADCGKLADAYAAGYCREANLISFRAWMARNKGLTLNWYQHGQFGRDRGWFVGDVFAAANLVNDRTQIRLQETITKDYFQLPAELANMTDVINQARFAANVSAFVYWMQYGSRGIGATDYAHAVYGRDVEKQFEGDVWNDSQGIVLEWRSVFYNKSGAAMPAGFWPSGKAKPNIKIVDGKTVYVDVVIPQGTTGNALAKLKGL